MADSIITRNAKEVIPASECQTFVGVAGEVIPWNECKIVVDYESIEFLPKFTGLYVVVFQNQIKYIGLAKNINKRWKNHHVSKRENLESHKIYCFEIHEENISKLETIWINFYKPPYNRTVINTNYIKQPTCKELSNRNKLSKFESTNQVLEFYKTLVSYLSHKKLQPIDCLLASIAACGDSNLHDLVMNDLDCYIKYTGWLQKDLHNVRVYGLYRLNPSCLLNPLGKVSIGWVVMLQKKLEVEYKHLNCTCEYYSEFFDEKEDD